MTARLPVRAAVGLWLAVVVPLGVALVAAALARGPLEDPDLADQVTEETGDMDQPDTEVNSAAAATGRRQHDMLFLHEPAPGLDQLALHPSQPAVVVFSAEERDLPKVLGCQLVRCADLSLAAEYALATSAGQIGPGYAVIDTAGQLRYLT